MISEKEAPRKHPLMLFRKVVKIVWISIQFYFVENDGYFLGASYHIIAAIELSTQETQEAPVII